MIYDLFSNTKVKFNQSFGQSLVTYFTWSGPTVGTSGIASTNFTVVLGPGYLPLPVTITYSGILQ